MRIRRIKKRFKNALTGIWIEENGQLPFWDNFIASRKESLSPHITVLYSLECFLDWLETMYFRYSGFTETGDQSCSFAEYIEYEYPSK